MTCVCHTCAVRRVLYDMCVSHLCCTACSVCCVCATLVQSRRALYAVCESHLCCPACSVCRVCHTCAVRRVQDYAVGRFEQYFKLKERLPSMLDEDH